MNRQIKFRIFFLASALMASSQTHAFVLSGQDWTWQPHPMGENFTICDTGANSINANEIAALQAAAQAWANVAIFDFTFGANACNAAPTFDGVNQISHGPLPASVWATTFWWWSNDDEIQEADIVFSDGSNGLTLSTANPTPPNQGDFQSIALHELGHVLSLGHAPPPAIMQASIPAGSQRRVLDPDDQNGIRAIYGADACDLAGLPCLTVNKILKHPDYNHLRLFNLTIDGVTVKANINSGSSGPQSVRPGSHTVSETGGTGTSLGAFGTVIGGDCAADGTITIATIAEGRKTCTITNYDNEGGCPSGRFCCEPGGGTEDCEPPGCSSACLSCSPPGGQCP